MFLLFVLLSLCGACLAAEPTYSCSPFEYDKQLLEKMIRQEFQYNKLVEEMKNIENRVNEKLQQLNVDRDSLKLETAQEKDKFQKYVSEKIADIEKERNVSRNEFYGMLENSTKHMQSQEDIVKNMKDMLSAGSVAFFSKTVKDTTPSAPQIFVFTEVNLNEGDGYDDKSGTFTAPVSGLYRFDMQLCLNGGSSNSIYFDIKANGNRIQSGYFRDYDTAKCYTSSVVVRLQSGGTVWVECSSCSGTMYQSSSLWNTFSGIRVHA